MPKYIYCIVLVATCAWIILTTIATMPLELEYKWQSWTIVAFGPVIVVVGLLEIIERIFFKRRG
jgi:hypothetical protein